VLEYAHPDRSRAYIGVFQLAGGETEHVVRPRGLDPSRAYEVRTDNNGQEFEASGRELERDGVRVRLDRALTSELLLFDAVPAGRK
jgi:hypothetical protein